MPVLQWTSIDNQRRSGLRQTSDFSRACDGDLWLGSQSEGEVRSSQLVGHAQSMRMPEDVMYFLKAVRELNKQVLQARPLRALVSHAGAGVIEATRVAVFEAVYEVAATFEPAHRAVHFRQLVGMLDALPDSSRSPCFKRLLAASIHPSMRDQQSDLLAVLATVLYLEPPSQRIRIFKEMLRAVMQLSVEHQAAPLSALIEQLPWLPKLGRKKVFEEVMRAIVQLPKELRAFRLSELKNATGWLPNSLQALATQMLDKALAEEVFAA